MTYKEALARCLDIYKSIYHCEYDVLNHMFFVLGNGYEWKNGELVADNDNETKEEVYARVMKDYGINLDIPSRYPLECRMNAKYTLYPINPATIIMNIPDNVQDDWLVAANRALAMASSIPKRPLDTQYLLQAKNRINYIIKDKQKANANWRYQPLINK